MGNTLSKDRDEPEQLDRESGANVTDLSERLDVTPYLEPTSDLVALMVLEHQTQMHNLITAASYVARSAAHQDRIVNEALGRPTDYQSPSTQRRIAAAGDKLLEYLLFRNEFQLTDPVSGCSSFAEDFQSRGPRDPDGRSLRDFDLQRRMFKYPCSYLIYSHSFDALPDSIRRYVTDRLLRILSEEDRSEAFAHLSAEDRRSILEILRATKPTLFTEPEAEPEPTATSDAGTGADT
jgi:hypothetical protein